MTVSLEVEDALKLFVVAFVSATLLPMGAEAALFGLLKLNPELLWPAIAVATAVRGTLSSPADLDPVEA